MSHWQQPPPLPPRSPRPNGAPEYQQPALPAYYAPPAAEQPPAMPPRPRSQLDLEGLSDTLRDSWRQLKSSIAREDASDGLRPPALPPRPVSPLPGATTISHEATSPAAVNRTDQHGAAPGNSSSGMQYSVPTGGYLGEQGHQSVTESRLDGTNSGEDRVTEDIDRLLGELSVSSHQVEHVSEAQQKARHPVHQVGDQRKEPAPRAPSPAIGKGNAPSPSSQGRAVSEPAEEKPIRPETACISISVTFPTTWYTHKEAPDIYICSRCYDDHLRDTPFKNEFDGAYLDDGQPRTCKFSTPRIQKQLLQEALTTGSLRDLIDHMKTRVTIPNCRGVNGARASEGIKWFNAKDDAIPGLVICEACWEDFAVVQSFAPRFQPVTTPQHEDAVWACDMAVPFIRKEYHRRSEAGDWPGFAAEAAHRLNIPPCAKAERAPRTSRKWLCPRDMPGVLVCAACFCDQILGTGEEGKFRESTEDPSFQYADACVCALGQFDIGIAMSFATDRKDYSLFWNALAKAVQGPACDPAGVKGATWYTLKSEPQDFFVCGLCFASIIESMDMGRFFVQVTGVPPDVALRCCLNPGFPRFAVYMEKLLEGYFAQSTTLLEAFAADYARLPVCRRETLLKNAVWFGWPDCTICPECHHEFIRGTALAPSMPYQGARWDINTMCKMYSPRMRALYLEACAASPPDPAALLTYSEHRTGVYIRTVMVIERIMMRQRMAIEEQKRLNGQSLFYTSLGRSEVNMLGSTHTYGAAGVGYGFENQNLLQGAIYGKQAREAGAAATSGSVVLEVGELERQWRAVE